MSFSARAGSGLVLSCLLLAACSEPPKDGGTAAPLLTGMFADHPVAGLRFSGSSSLTNRQGEFTYRQGDTVRFFIGTDANPGIDLGSAPGAVAVTPRELVPQATAITDPRITNRARLLQALDSDCDLSNGIDISPAARTAAPTTLDFSQAEADFETSIAPYLAMPGVTGCTAVPNGEAARNDFQPTLNHIDEPSNQGRANRLPTADPGFDLQPNEGELVVLDGSGSSDEDGTIAAYQWTQLSGPTVTLDGAETDTASFTAPLVNAETTLIFRLRVTDNDNGAHSATVRVVVQNNQVNNAPIADAGDDQTVGEADAVTLDGSNSRDPEDGSVGLTYEWTQAASDTVDVTLTGANTVSPGFTAPAVSGADVVLHFTLVVRDSQGLASAADEVVITVEDDAGNGSPIARILPHNETLDEPDQIVDEGSLVSMDGSTSSDPEDDPLTFAWAEAEEFDLHYTDDPHPVLQGTTSAATSFTAPDVDGDQEAYYDLVVADDHGNSDDAETVIRIIDADKRFTVVASPAPMVTEGNSGTTQLAFKVRLDRRPLQAVSVRYRTADLTAVAPGDYVAASGQLVFAPGDAANPDGSIEKTVNVTVNGDAFDENDETLRFELFDEDGAGVNARAVDGTIQDDDSSTLLRVGATKQSVTPSQQHIDGVEEPRLGAAAGAPSTHLQKFNLGGFGINVAQNFPDPFGDIPGQATTTEPAGARVFEGSNGAEHTHLRLMAIDDPADKSRLVVFVMLDAIGAGNLIQKGVKAAIIEAARAHGYVDAFALTEDRILFGQTHTHAGADLQGLWGGVPQDWIVNTLYARARAGADTALKQLKPARLHFRQGTTQDFNNYRRPRVQDLEADADGHLSLLEARGDDGTRIGSILQYNAHPTSIGDGVDPRRPHADYIQGAMDWLEDPATGLGGAALYFNGPIADASPSGSRSGCTPVSADQPFSGVRCRGEGMANAALGFTARELAPTIAPLSVEVTLPVTNPLFVVAGGAGTFNRYYDFAELPTSEIPGLNEQLVDLPQITPTATTLVTRITLGGETDGLEIVTIPGETTNTFGAYIRGLAQTEMMLFGLTQNSFGYIIPEEEFNYFNASGDDGFVLPFTGYEEFVSLGPLTAPLLRIEGYNRLFPGAPEENIPAYIRACQDPMSEDCATNVIGRDLEYIQSNLAQQCIANGGPAQFCALLDPQTPLAALCSAQGFPDGFCSVFGTPGAAAPSDAALIVDAADAQLRGCDLLDPSHCLLPFPSDHFTRPAAAGSRQSTDVGGTGKRVEFSLAAMPRNAANKPVDPTEWNRQDGFSPGQMIVAYVPGLAANADGTVPGAPPITDIGQSLEVATSSVVVLDAETGEPHPVWAEIDLNAGFLLPSNGVARTDPTKPTRAALIIRPAKNFAEGRRYVVALKNLRNAANAVIPAQAAFTMCRDGIESVLPPVVARCEALADDVFPVLDAAGIDVAGNAGLFLAWDFTVASAENNVGRLRQMRDVAFASLGQLENGAGEITLLGLPPEFTVTDVIENPDSRTARTVKGTFKVPSFVTPVDPSPLDGTGDVQEQLATLTSQFPDLLGELQNGCEDFGGPAELCDVLGIGDLGDATDIAGSASLPPNRLFYSPVGGTPSPDPNNPADPLSVRYGDGLPDTLGTMTTTFTCHIPKVALNGKVFADATALDVRPARPTIYGHGLLGSQGEVGSGPQKDMISDHNMLYCATDWFGFATGDIVNVVSVLGDLSNFPVIPDASQQGMLNQMFLARLLKHPLGFAADPAFQAGGATVVDTREVFYDGNSQGGILAGPVVALSKDVNRGVFGVVGMNYSTLLTRSVDFDIYSIPLYLAYQDDLDRDLAFSLMQMLWDRSENNGYAHHLTDNSFLDGPDNQILLHAAFADHQVTHWSAQVMARTIGVDVADMYQRKPGEGEPFTFADKFAFFAQRDPDIADFWDLPLFQRTGGGSFDNPCTGASGNCRTTKSGYVEFDQGRTAIPPIGNVPPRADDHDPHGHPRGSKWGQCQKSHFLHTQGRLIDTRSTRNVLSPADCPTIPPPAGSPPDTPGTQAGALYGDGVFGAVAQFFARMNDVITAMIDGQYEQAAAEFQTALTDFATQMAAEPGLGEDPRGLVERSLVANRDAEAVVLTGDKLAAWSVPPAVGAPYPFPSGVGGDGEALTCEGLDPNLGTGLCVRDAHNGVILYPAADTTLAPMGVTTSRIAAYRFQGGAFVEVPVQVDQRFPYFLANANSGFSFYSGTDEELTYEWDVERWQNGDPEATTASYEGATPDPVSGLDHDDEVVFMARDAGAEQAGPTDVPSDPDFDAAGGLQEIVLTDPLAIDAGGQQPNAPRFIYLGLKKIGETGSFHGTQHYVSYQRDANADQWIDRWFFKDDPVDGLDPDPERVGNSNSGYGPNLSGKVQPGTAHYEQPQNCSGSGPNRVCSSTDRFPRDGLTVTTDSYLWRASGRWMVREISVAKPGQPGVYGDDLIDRWKGRAFQQSPDSNISVVGFEDEQVNWEGNSTLLGERCGPVRCMREVWGADSGTNVTKTETFYRDAVNYRYHVRVHPIPPDGLYTSWDYNRGAMVSDDPDVPGGRYYTALRPLGVPVDGINDDVGQVDGFAPVAGQCPTLDGPAPPDDFGRCPAFFDAADPTFNLPLSFDNWEQVSGKGDSGSLVYIFELKGGTSLLSPLVVPYYRDDKCLDDGTGDDPVQRPWPGESLDDSRVMSAYAKMAGKESFADVTCDERQGVYAAHGIHYFVTGDTDNAFLFGKPVTEIDGAQWQFMVPTAAPTNVGDTYANVVRAPLVAAIVSRPGVPGLPGSGSGGVLGMFESLASDFEAMIASFTEADPFGSLDAFSVALHNLGEAFQGLLYEDAGSVLGSAGQVAGADSTSEVGGAITNGAGQLLFGVELGPGFKAGVGVVDDTADVGFGAGQYADKSPDTPDGEMDPYATHKAQKKSYGVQSRTTSRAIVIEGSNGKRIALVKNDNYLAQDLLLRRVGQILEEGRSGIAYSQIMHHATHAHSTAYASTLAWGVWVFQDAYDARFFEHQARALAQAIELAAQNLQPAKMGGTSIVHRVLKGNVVRPSRADDGTPAGYPHEYGDVGVAVLRFENLDGDPIAVYVNHGQHPEGTDGLDLHSADYVAPLERFVEQQIGAPLVFSQGDVGSAENSANTDQRIGDDGLPCSNRAGTVPFNGGCDFGEGVVRDWQHKEYVAMERGARFLADDVVEAWDAIGAGNATVPLSRNHPVEYLTYWVPGPLSHPYPSVSNCRTEPTAGGDTGAPILGLPDCERTGFPGDNPISAQLALLYNTMKVEGVPVPEHYDATAFTGVEENLRLMLQAFKIGDVLLASCACEVQNDLVLNLESRTNDAANDIYDGFDWACLIDEFKNQNGPGYPAKDRWVEACARQRNYFKPEDFSNGFQIGGENRDPALIARMRHQVHNDALNWDAVDPTDPAAVAAANAEPADATQIKGNFTKQEIQAFGVPGFKLPIAVGHSGDYNGYTVSYREYMNRDHYRKALTSYGPHTADYMVTRLTKMAAVLQGAPSLVLVPEVHDPVAVADELRQEALARGHGQVSANAYEAFASALADDLGPVQALQQPASIQRFNATTFRWRGGTTAADNPLVRVQQQLAPGLWLDTYDMTGEVQTRVQWPVGPDGVASALAGQFSWEWTANFEAYSAFPARLGSTQAGTYRFCVNGHSRKNRASQAYALCSNAFTVSPWSGIAIANVSRSAASVSFQVPAITYPRTVNGGPFDEFYEDNNDPFLCTRCSFRPWAQLGRLASAVVTGTVAGNPQTFTASCSGSAPATCNASVPSSATNVRIRVLDQDANVGEVAVP